MSMQLADFIVLVMESNCMCIWGNRVLVWILLTVLNAFFPDSYRCMRTFRLPL
jgi:hypothetical protein